MTNIASRLITLILLLQRQPNQSASQLARALDVSVRTVQRYISELDEMGIPVYAERGPYGGYALVRGYKMPPLVFSPEEAVALYLGANLLEEVWGPLYQEAARGALAKLDNVLPEEQRREAAWARQTLLATGIRWANPAFSDPHLIKLHDAAREHRRVRMRYRGRNQAEISQRDFDPYRLVHAWGWQYCVGYCHLRQAIRSFRIDRILNLTVLDQSFEIPGSFNLQAYIETDPFFQPQVHVRMSFAPESALLAQDNRAVWESFEGQPDGSVIVTFSTLDLDGAANVVLRYGDQALVLEPAELRALLRERASAIAARYCAVDSSDIKPEAEV